MRVIQENETSYNVWPYEFKWIDNLGSQLIRKVRYMIGGQDNTGIYRTIFI